MDNKLNESTNIENIEGKMSKIDLGKDNILKIFLYYAIPSIIGMMAMSSAGIIDGIFVGQYVGPDALAAVNLAMPLLYGFYGVAIMISLGGATLANIKRGEGNIKESNNYFTITLYLTLGLAIVATIGGLVFSGEFATLLGAQEDTHELVATYLSIITIFFIPFLGTFTLDMFLRNDGFPVFPIVCTISGSAINIILDYILIKELGMGIAGAAMATGISQVIPMIIMLVFILLISSWRIVIPNLRIKDIGAMLFNGSSELLSNISVAISGFIFNLIIMKEIGTVGVAAYSVANYAAMIAIAIFFGIASAINPGVSFNKGSGDFSRVLAFKKIGIIFSLICGILIAVCLLTFGGKIVHMFVGENLVVRELAIHIIRFYSVSMILMGVNVVSSMYYTAINEPLISASIAASRSLVFLILGVIILPIIFGHDGIWASIVFAELVTLFITIICFKKRPC